MRTFGQLLNSHTVKELFEGKDLFFYRLESVWAFGCNSYCWTRECIRSTNVLTTIDLCVCVWFLVMLRSSALLVWFPKNSFSVSEGPGNALKTVLDPIFL